MANPQDKTTYDGQFNREYGEFGTKFEFGSNPSAELWNGRLAMIGFLGALLVELTTGQGFFHWLGLF
ncbi:MULTISPECIES: chlorophyll a/b-binding protein [Cyanophyceae]|uniref:chlorophyll a/b-binding protein n=1 Tax=Cyanophyceae TaxID=3028117 RepID=UPI001683BF08|nr:MULTISPECIES: chlorophyll a/b-binding protein [Cyanophyceae]MBD1918170.1 chlorophyll A-B binding protein [Phormidium sp. FACHB-77]MBD2030202.1 chlorophyll A-B binding protein [Phormidium sp. FACHB-322]MBD2051426.1 chlorophyll A-B binding protein [Leptolyngbya sp. FACHB-60]